VVLLDNRNSFEYRLGHFQNAIDPQVTNFRDFPAYVREPTCPNGRPRASAWPCTAPVASAAKRPAPGCADMDVPVYQLEGGILNYFKEMPDAEQRLAWRMFCV
jgi:UPF0176 protein